MSWKTIFTVSCGCLYLILGALLFYNYRTDFLCGYESPCLRFCASDHEKHSDKELFDSLMENNITRWYAAEFDDVRIFRGLPECSGQIINVKENEEKSIDVSHFYYSFGSYIISEDGKLSGKGFSYSLSKYCMQKNVGDEMENIKEDYLKEWMPMVCVNESILQKPVLITMAVLSIIILAHTLLIYVYFSDLHDFNGMMIICFLISMLCTYILIPGIFQVERSTPKIISLFRGFAFTSGSLWLNSMLLNIYFRNRNFRTSKSGEGRFKSYVNYVLFFTIFAVLFVLWESQYKRYRSSGAFVSMVHTYLIFNDLVILIITSFIIRKVSKQIDFSEREVFQKEKKIFWIYVKLFAIMSVTWSTQIYVTTNEFNHFGCLTATLIMLFSAVNVSGLFLGRKKVRELLYKKYRGDIEENN